MSTETATPTTGKGGKFLTFALGDEEYGLEILKVKEIIGQIQITPVPRTPPYVRGVMNLRGQVIPVIDLRMKFGLGATVQSDQTCVIVVEIQGQGGGAKKLFTGIFVDRVCEVQQITDGQIEPAPAFDASVTTDFILGMGKVNDSVKILLNIDRVLSVSDVSTIGQVSGRTAAAA